MSLSANTVFEVRTSGADTNGGGFATGASGTDWSQQNAPQYALANGVTNGTATIGLASASADMVGNIAYVAGGTGAVAAGWYQILSVVAGASITVDRSTGLTAGTGVTLNVGGALASPAVAQAVSAANGSAANIVFVKYSPSVFPITAATTGVPGGCLSGPAMLCGYNTTRTPLNADALQPTLQLQSGVSSATIATTTATSQSCRNIVFDGNGQTSSKGNTFHVNQNCTFKNFTAGAVTTSGTVAIGCQFTGNSTVVPCQVLAWGCVAFGNTVTPFSSNCFECISYGNTGATTDGFGSTNTFGTLMYVNCVAYGNGRYGFYYAGGLLNVINGVAESNSGFGFVVGSPLAYLILSSCSAFGNASGRSSANLISDLNPITPSASVFVSAVAANFVLNNTAGAGALLRGTGWPATFPGGQVASFRDVGAAQHQDSGGGGGGGGTRRFGIGFGG